jgi:chromosome segregation protein
MQLNRLEIKGFKSFGDKITIHFDAGITGIVGPNGCGKSNVVDAIRWVLGEQRTKSLRSEKMEGVIFNGTKNRKQGQMAEVTLTFTNTKNILPTEFSQVSITRRYYRSGDSEYLLNGITCRLKDITNLFMDTGIGPDSYAIIELKMVEDLLSDKDNSRRTLFEEAAGISKFKARKKETLKRLEDTDKDLERVEDLLFEIVKNLKQLEKQAKQAEQYFDIKNDYKLASVELARFLLFNQMGAQQRLQEQVSKAETERSNLTASLATAQASAEKTKAGLIDQEKLLASRQKALNEHVDGIRTNESEKKLKNERLNYLTERQKQLKQQQQQDNTGISQVTEVLAQLEVETQSLINETAQAKEAFEQATTLLSSKQQRHATAQKDLVEHQAQLKQRQEAVYKLRKTLEIAQIQLQTLNQELAKSDDEANAQTESLGDFRAKLEALNADIEARIHSVDKLEADEVALAKRLEDNLLETEKLKDQATKLNRELDAKQNEYNLTKSLVDGLEGYPEAIKFLKKNTDWNAQATLLSDVLTCPETYRVAIENYLEGYMNYYVVETEIQALQAISLLSRSAKGRANFFVLEKFDAFRATPTQLVPNTIHALDIVECDLRYQKLVEWLLDNTYLAQTETLPDNQDISLLTQSGSITRKQYIYSGGSIGIFEGKRIGRAKNLDKLQADIGKQADKVAALRQQIGNKQQEVISLRQQSKKADIETAKRDLNRLQQEQVALRTRHEQISLLITSSSNRRHQISERIVALQQDVANTEPALSAEETELATAEKHLTYLAALVETESHALNEAQTLVTKQQVLYTQRTTTLQGREQELKYRRDELVGLERRISKNDEEITKLAQEISGLTNKAVINDEELSALYTERDGIEAGVVEAEKAYYAVRGNIDQLEKEARQLLNQRDLADQLLNSLRQQLTDSQMALNSVLERTSIEFEVSLDQASLADYVPIEGISEDALRQKVGQTKNRLDRLGPINPMAMEAYKEIKERHDFITTQKADLALAKESLMSTIDEIETVATQSFMETFTQVRDHFKNVFQSLFTNEDTCDLILEDPTKPLDSAIDIIARPKGKRPQSISQLSSGEKTLTAISLLFSIYLIKPAPFCIFDEVDAPLDDANIDKFNTIIRKFSGDSQFIIVTHNKRTMASTDVMYGVTMIEQGISRVIPVDLRALQEEGV